jgi:short-subunit dehydrogenase
MPDLTPLDEQVVVITGASSGIGLATALLAASRGAKVVLAARNVHTLDQLVAQIVDSGGEALAVETDVGLREQLFALAEASADRFGRIDTWANVAGVAIYGKLEDVSDGDHRRLFDVNFWGVVNGSLAALPHLRKSGGALVNVGSELSESVIPLQGMYAASKHAVKGFTDALRVELENVEDAGVSITLIQPTAVDTPYAQHARNYMDREPKLPTPGIDPQRVAEAILDAATRGGRDVKVGAMAHVDTALGKVLPALGDRFAASMADQQQEPRKPVAPEGTLYKPGGEGQIHGMGTSRQ